MQDLFADHLARMATDDGAWLHSWGIRINMDAVTSKKPQVGVFSRYYPEYRDGVFSRLARSSTLGFVFLAGPPPPGSFIKASDRKEYQFRSISVRALPIPGTRNIISYLGAPITSMIRREYDVLILTNDILELDVWLCCILSHWLHIPVCIWGQGLSRPPTRFRDELRHRLTSLATAALYYTDHGKDLWVSKGVPQEKLFVAYNALDTDKQIRIRGELTRDEMAAFLGAHGLSGRTIVTFLGRLIPEKKPWVFLEAVEKASILEPGIVGLIIGDGPERQRLEMLVQERGLTHVVRFIGSVYDEETMAKYLMSSVAMVLPAFAGLAIQHAAVYGVPLILGDLPDSHGPEQEIVEQGKTGLWCPDEDTEAFAAAIAQLTRDRSLRGHLSENLLRAIDSKYNLARMAQGFIDAVEYCLKSKV